MNIRYLFFSMLLLNSVVYCEATEKHISLNNKSPVKPRLILPKLPFWQSSYSLDQIVTAASNYFTYNRLKLTENDIDDVIAEINYYAYTLRIDTKKIFRGLDRIIEKNLMYHRERIINRNHYKNLAYDCAKCIGLAGISAAFIVATYAVYKKWNQGSDGDINRLTQELNRMDIKVITNYDHDFNTRLVRLVPPMEISDQEMSIAKLYQKQLIDAFKVKAWAVNGEIMSAFAGFCSGLITFSNVYDFLVPKHQEKYEKLLLIRKKIDVQLNIQV